MNELTFILVGAVAGLLVAMSMLGQNNVHIHQEREYREGPMTGCAGIIWFVAFGFIILLAVLGPVVSQSGPGS